MTAACSEVLGYEQPVCEKPLAVAAPAAEEGLRGSDGAEMAPEPEVAMVSVPPHGEAVSHASHESSEFEFGGAQPPSPADGQAEDEDATEVMRRPNVCASPCLVLYGAVGVYTPVA